MELKTAIEILGYHQEWRLGKREDMIAPKELTGALDIALSEVKKLPIHSAISRFEREEWEAQYLPLPSKERIEQQERAFNAALAYEKNCIAKYDYIDNRPSRPPKEGERMEDFARRYRTTIREMKDQWQQVERALANGL